jgi:hypothetical protein
MVFKMASDVISFLALLTSMLLSFAAAFLVLFEPAQPASNWPWNVPNDPPGGDCMDNFVGYAPTLKYLIEYSITGDIFFSCGSQSDVSEPAWLLSIAFYTVGGLLLLNMLIAMMVPCGCDSNSELQSHYTRSPRSYCFQHVPGS